MKRLYLPASVPKLVYNSILSWVAGWYFLIACEIIVLGPVNYRLPGLGSFLMESSDKGRIGELIAGLVTLLVIILRDGRAGVAAAVDLGAEVPLRVRRQRKRRHH